MASSYEVAGWNQLKTPTVVAKNVKGAFYGQCLKEAQFSFSHENTRISYSITANRLPKILQTGPLMLIVQEVIDIKARIVSQLCTSINLCVLVDKQKKQQHLIEQQLINARV